MMKSQIDTVITDDPIEWDCLVWLDEHIDPLYHKAESRWGYVLTNCLEMDYCKREKFIGILNGMHDVWERVYLTDVGKLLVNIR